MTARLGKICPAQGTEAVRVLSARDSADFREIRLEALLIDGRYFAASYEEEKDYTDDHWMRWCTERPDNCVMGLFAETELVGITTAMSWGEDATGRTVFFGRSFIKPEYRGKGLAALLYGARIDWAKKNPLYTEGVVFHREGNWLSKQINEKFGARYWQTRSMRWADGQVADALWYKIQLR